MSSYLAAAKKIVKSRESKNVLKSPSNADLASIKTSFIAFILKGNFKNVIDLIIEWYDINIDELDFEFLLQEILCQEGVTITDQINLSITKSPTIIFKNVYGMSLVFTDSQNTGQSFHLTISRFLHDQLPFSSDPSKETLAELVADCL